MVNSPSASGKGGNGEWERPMCKPMCAEIRAMSYEVKKGFSNIRNIPLATEGRNFKRINFNMHQK